MSHSTRLAIETDGIPRPVAVIDIGATSIRMAIAEIQNGNVRTLDTLVQSVDLGREAFQSRRLSRASIERSASIFKGYREVLQQYGITSPQDIRVVATTAVREAINRLAFADRIFVATGLNVNPIDEAEVNRITYMGVTPHLMAHPELADGKSIVVEVGGGSTEVLVVRSGNVLKSHSYRLGSLRMLLPLDALRTSAQRRRSILESQIRRTLEQIWETVEADPAINLVALGGDVRFAAKKLIDWDGESLAQVPTKKLVKFTEKILMLDQDAIVKQYGASFIEAETLGPALLVYTSLVQRFSLPHLYVCDTNLRDGLLHDIAAGGAGWTAEFRNQILRSAMALGRKFSFDETHARNVAEIARMLFLQLQTEHKLDSRHEVILFAAALLHEVGTIVNVRSNHKHALYIIRNSDLFGLSRGELLQVGLVARYHRRATPQPSHEGYRTLPQEDRVVVAKLASLLRLAIALDDTRTGRIREVACKFEGKQLIIHVPGVDDVSLEQIAMRENSGLFADVFGMPVTLRAGKLP